jgi:HSP20 family protein
MQGSSHSGGGSGHGSHQVDRWFRELLLSKNPLGILTDSSWQPPTDVFETSDSVVVRMEIPGLDVESLSICLADDVLTVRGRRDDACEHRKIRFQQLEIHFGYFERSIPLAFPIKHQETHASYREGFLMIVMPRAAQEPAASTFYIKINL